MRTRLALVVLITALGTLRPVARPASDHAPAAAVTGPPRVPRGALAASSAPDPKPPGRATPAPQVLPATPPGVTDLKFGELYKPIGPQGLEYAEKTKQLAGTRVRLLGYMVKQEQPKPGLFLLSPVPAQTHEEEMGLADDLPASIVYVFPATDTDRVPQYTPGLLLLTGTLRTGSHDEADGRVSMLRLELDPPSAMPAESPSARPGANNSTTAAPTLQPAP